MGEKRWFIMCWRNFAWFIRGPYTDIEEAKAEQKRDYGMLVEEIG